MFSSRCYIQRGFLDVNWNLPILLGFVKNFVKVLTTISNFLEKIGFCVYSCFLSNLIAFHIPNVFLHYVQF